MILAGPVVTIIRAGLDRAQAELITDVLHRLLMLNDPGSGKHADRCSVVAF